MYASLGVKELDYNKTIRKYTRVMFCFAWLRFGLGWHFQYTSVGYSGTAVTLERIHICIIWIDNLNTFGFVQIILLLQTTFPNAFSWKKIVIVWSKCQSSFFPMMQFTISPHWNKYWLDYEQATCHYQNHFPLSSMSPYGVTVPHVLNPWGSMTPHNPTKQSISKRKANIVAYIVLHTRSFPKSTLAISTSSGSFHKLCYITFLALSRQHGMHDFPNCIFYVTSQIEV